MERCTSGGRSFTLKTMGPWSDVLGRKVLYLKDHGAMERCTSGGRSFTLKTMGPWSDVLVEEGPLP